MNTIPMSRQADGSYVFIRSDGMTIQSQRSLDRYGVFRITSTTQLRDLLQKAIPYYNPSDPVRTEMQDLLNGIPNTLRYLDRYDDCSSEMQNQIIKTAKELCFAIIYLEMVLSI
jgi:hypothetical protein